MDQIKVDGFDFELDDRYHCRYCGFNTQLPNKAENHLQLKHDDQLAAAEDQEPGQEQDQDEWGPEPGHDQEPEFADKKLDEEE